MSKRGKYNEDYETHNKKYKYVKERLNHSVNKREALKEFKEFILEYPKDDLAKAEYAKNALDFFETTEEEREEALNILSTVSTNSNAKAAKIYYITIIEQSIIKKDFEKAEKLLDEVKGKKVLSDFDLDYLRIKLLLKEKKFDIAFKLMQNTKTKTPEEQIKLVLLRLNHDLARNNYINSSDYINILNDAYNKKNINAKAYFNNVLKLYCLRDDVKKAYEMYQKCDKNIIYLRTYESLWDLFKNYELDDAVNSVMVNMDKCLKIIKTSPYELFKLKVILGSIDLNKENIIAAVNEDSSCIGIIITKLCENRKFDLIMELFDELDEKNIFTGTQITIFINTYIYKKDYFKANQILNKYSNLLVKNYSLYFKMVSLYLSKFIDNGYVYNPKNEQYTYKQINDYNINLLYEHLKKHTNTSSELFNYYIFDEKLSVEEIVSKLQDAISKIEPITVGVVDQYNVYIPGLCPDSNRIVVCAIGGTNNIITCYPKGKKDNLFDEEITQDELEDYKKSHSAIDKFNKRYGRK